MKRSIASTLFLGFFTLILVWSPAYAAKQVATVVAVRGDAQAFDAKGKSRPLAVQTPIFEEDTIKTGERGRTQIMFTDNTQITLGNATTMKIAEYRWQAEQNDGALKTQVKEGTFRIMGGALTKTAPRNFKTETPSATIGIRGSMYAGVVTPDFLSVVFQGGKGIEITNAFGTVEISKPGFGTKVAMNKPPLPPMKFSAQELEEINKSLSGSGADDKKEEQKEKTPAPKDEQGAMAAPTHTDTASSDSGETTTPSLTPLPPNDEQGATAAPSHTDTASSDTGETTPPPLAPMAPKNEQGAMAASSHADTASSGGGETITPSLAPMPPKNEQGAMTASTHASPTSSGGGEKTTIPLVPLLQDLKKDVKDPVKEVVKEVVIQKEHTKTIKPAVTSVANDFITWGYWEIADTDGGKNQLFSSQSFFVTGQETSKGIVDNLISNTFTGTYLGKALGVQLDSTGQNVTRLTSSSGTNPWGTVNLNINFAAAAATPASGTFTFDQATLHVTSSTGQLTRSGFQATITGTTTSAINGAFYGPAAEAVGGKFDAVMGTGVRYLGVFGGNR